MITFRFGKPFTDSIFWFMTILTHTSNYALLAYTMLFISLNPNSFYESIKIIHLSIGFFLTYLKFKIYSLIL